MTAEVRQKTRREIIDETAAAYTSETRAYDPSVCACVYRDCAGRMCAVGRCLVNAPLNDSTPVGSLLRGEDDSLLMPEYHGHPVKFWKCLQNLHDTRENWNKTGLSARGRDFVASLHADWNEA